LSRQRVYLVAQEERQVDRLFNTPERSCSFAF